MVLALKGFLQVFDHIVALTNGGPGTATESVSLVIYRGGFQGGEFAYQMANAVIFFIVIVVVLALPAPNSSSAERRLLMTTSTTTATPHQHHRPRDERSAPGVRGAQGPCKVNWWATASDRASAR